MEAHRPEVGVTKCVRVEPATVYFHSKQLLQSDITEVHMAAEFIKERKLARFVWSFKHEFLQPKRLNEAMAVLCVQGAALIKKTNSLCAFPCLNHKLNGPAVQP